MLYTAHTLCTEHCQAYIAICYLGSVCTMRSIKNAVYKCTNEAVDIFPSYLREGNTHS